MGIHGELLRTKLHRKKQKKAGQLPGKSMDGPVIYSIILSLVVAVWPAPYLSCPVGDNSIVSHTSNLRSHSTDRQKGGGEGTVSHNNLEVNFKYFPTSSPGPKKGAGMRCYIRGCGFRIGAHMYLLVYVFYVL